MTIFHVSVDCPTVGAPFGYPLYVLAVLSLCLSSVCVIFTHNDILSAHVCGSMLFPRCDDDISERPAQGMIALYGDFAVCYVRIPNVRSWRQIQFDHKWHKYSTTENFEDDTGREVLTKMQLSYLNKR